MKILAIETSCDETAVAVVEKLDNGLVKVWGNPLRSSQLKHIETGGIVPEVAAREQIKAITPVVLEVVRSVMVSVPSTKYQELSQKNTLTDSVEWINQNIDAIAVTQGPGLIGSLLVGVETAKALALAWGIPLIPVNHLLGHIYANWIETQVSGFSDQGSESSEARNLELGISSLKIKHQESRVKSQEKSYQSDSLTIRLSEKTPPTFPLITLTVSGGHTSIILMKDHSDYEVVGSTRDDAAGECFDKCARALGFPYPGGPHIARLANKHQESRVKSQEKSDQSDSLTIRLSDNFSLPRPLLHEDTLDMSFSGLKAAFVREVRSLEKKEHLSEEMKQLLAYELERAIVEVLVKKVSNAFERFNPESFLLAGGVSANLYLRSKLEDLCKQHDRQYYKPELEYTMDNAAMIGAAAIYHSTTINPLRLKANPGLIL